MFLAVIVSTFTTQSKMAKQTIDAFFSAKPGHLQQQFAEKKEKSGDESPVVVKKPRRQLLRQEWLSEFMWLRYCKTSSTMNCVFCSQCTQHAGKTKFAEATGTTQFKHDTLMKQNISLKHKRCRDRYVNETGSPLPTAFRRQEVNI